ncbi:MULTISPECIES: GtrA family protein [Tabrizicola]|uniref:GtrA family protein n=1 Tax=Tabrizicola TaxID=1443919 RepID=UPI001436BDA2|nr:MULTISPECIES: GtrA family protein [Paracoccaceae]
MLAQLVRFGGVGALATLAHVMVALVVQAALSVTPQQANLAGFAAAIVLSYAGHARVTFGAPVKSGSQLVRFLVLSLLGLGASSLTVHVTTDLLGWGFLPALAAVAVVVPTLSYLAMRFWVFARSDQAAR